MTMSTTLWFVYKSLIYCGLSGLFLTCIRPLKIPFKGLSVYWLLNIAVMGTWLLSQFSEENWFVTSTLLRWSTAIWLNANMAYAAAGICFLPVFWLSKFICRRPIHTLWLKPNIILIPFMVMLSVFGVYEAMSPPLLRHYDVYSEQLPHELDGLRIAQITDSHIGDFIGADELKHAVERLNAENPDLLVMTGDLLDDDRQLDSSFSALASSDVPLGVIAILGNHEKYHGLTTILNKYDKERDNTRIQLLVDDTRTLTFNNKTFQVVGVDYPIPPDSRGSKIDDEKFDENMRLSAQKTFAKVDKNKWILCLTHHPNFFDLSAANNADLSLAGHTHGGQVLPLGYTIGRYQYKFHYLKGWFSIQSHQLFVSTGMGHVWPYRLGVPPEIVIFTLHQKK